MSKSIKDKLALLKETAAAFTIETRCVNRGGGCKYYMEGKQGCAIGRLIPDKELCKALDNMKPPGVSEGKVFNMLPENLREYGRAFLVELQDLHDGESYWNKDGLSDFGRERVARIAEDVESGII